MSIGGNIIHYWNYAPLWSVVGISIFSILFWFGIMSCFKNKRKVQVFINRCMLFLDLSIILFFTIFIRHSNDYAIVNLVPLNALVRAQEQDTIYREIWMNILMFMPFGMSLPCGFKISCKCTVFLGLLCSLCIELVQFIFKLGTCELDDIIANTIGVCIGVLCVCIFRKNWG